MRHAPMRGRTCWLCGRNGNGDPLDASSFAGISGIGPWGQYLKDSGRNVLPKMKRFVSFWRGGAGEISEHCRRAAMRSIFTCSDDGGANRRLSEKYGLWVPLCHRRCHESGAEAVHRNAGTMQRLHEYGQRLAMEEQGWSREEFRAVFGRNYLPEGWEPETRDEDTGFTIEEDDIA